MAYTLGIDIGSTTVKVVLLCDGQPIFEKYERHYSAVREKTDAILTEAASLIGDNPFTVAISGSAGLGLANESSLPFVQEVYATSRVVEALEPDTSCVIELGGEDAKIIFFDGGIDERMNGSCAGGTGAFIDQMATLLDVSADELDELSLKAQRIYPIASRCGVFAKTDIQPLLNQGASKSDVAMSIYKAVVNQTIAGLAQGKKIRGKVLFLGGPLYYCKGLRKCFAETLHLDEEHAVFPPFARYSVAMGAALYAEKSGENITMDALLSRIRTAKAVQTTEKLEPLFLGNEDYGAFRARHQKDTLARADLASYMGNAYLGIDCGSTTTKLALISENKELLYTYYASNRGDPVEIVRRQLTEIYAQCGDRVRICGSAVTGYGEELIKNAFSVDHGMVETIAHFTAAKHFMPDVNFILDIGGQDIKCFKIKNGAIDSIMLNEACSSGCGSFLETFARSLGCTIEDFATRGLFAKHPVNLGSRCTVFMNSSVKQAQKDGATVEDISAGLSISVVKNALYKVIRVASAEELGKNVVVQGGTFYNDAVLRAFEKELGGEVVRPDIAGLMGAFGAALYSMRTKESTLLSKDALASFSHTARATVCKGCTNHCSLTVNTFADGRRFISGNRCEKGAGLKKSDEPLPNLYAKKRQLLTAYGEVQGTRPETVGLPLSLGMFELLPLWHTFFKEMGFSVRVSAMSTRRTYEKGQFSIPSDTACYPAKLMHGHIAELLEDKTDAIFYPCLTYNVDEKTSDNHYNCPVVAYYSELLAGNVEELSETKFLYPYLNVNNQKELSFGLYRCLSEKFEGIAKRDVTRAVKKAFAEYERFEETVRAEGTKAVEYARAHGKPIMILAGRPYHIDSEIGHGIDELANSLGFAVVSEDSVCRLAQMRPVNVLNQWTYHSRLYGAAFFAAENPDVQLVQLVSFGCGVDAITTDEVRAILEKNGKLYTQLKIDEITGLGAVKIRLRSLIGAIEEKQSLEKEACK
ncbi:MAG: 2-hydroxyacyl-CoA dehydratase [Clostridia bacterium]|nr:2-hydroxyacyl-CoA dehydratase [Clostridia bacterium]